MGDVLIDLTGKRFGHWTVIKRLPNRGRALIWECQCDCGRIVPVHGTSLKSGTSLMCRSCSCKRPRTHGLTHHRLHRIWSRMKGCTGNPNHHDYKWYGARGIGIDEDWRNHFASFYNWAINNGYTDDLTIDRIDVTKGYCPENCRWIPLKEQAYNTRKTIWVEWNGETKPLRKWGEARNIKPTTLYARYYNGWSVPDLFKPVSGGSK